MEKTANSIINITPFIRSKINEVSSFSSENLSAFPIKFITNTINDKTQNTFVILYYLNYIIFMTFNHI